MSSPAEFGIVGPCIVPVCCEYQRMMHQTYQYCKVFLTVQVSQGDLQIHKTLIESSVIIFKYTLP